MTRHTFRQRRKDATPSTNLVYGLNPDREVVARSPRMIATLYVAHGIRGAESLVADARRHGIAVEIVERDALERMSDGGNHQGVAARTKAFEFQAIEDVVQVAASLVVVLDGMTDPQNVGAIIRSAEVLGAGALVLPKDRSAAISDPKKVKLVHLAGDFNLILERMSRREHFMKPDMLKSQFETLEAPTEAVTVNIAKTPEDIVAEIRRHSEPDCAV